MRKILITGGAGFIGSNFVRYIRKISPGDLVVVLDKLTYAGNMENLRGVGPAPGYRFIRGDINDPFTVERIFREYGIDTVVNFAAESHVDLSILNPREFINTNILGTFTLLESARKHWRGKGSCRRERFIHVSTDEVFGSLGETGRFTEDSPYSPSSPYSASKASSDHLVRSYYCTYGLPVMTTNCSNNYGPYQFPEKFIPLMIINSLRGKSLPVYGDGKNVRDWLYVVDHCRAIEQVMAQGRVGEVYNISGGNEWRNIDIANLICELVDRRVRSDRSAREMFPFRGSRNDLITFVKDRLGHDRRYAIDCTKIERELGWSPETDFEEGLSRVVDWYVKNCSWWGRILSGEYKEYRPRRLRDDARRRPGIARRPIFINQFL